MLDVTFPSLKLPDHKKMQTSKSHTHKKNPDLNSQRWRNMAFQRTFAFFDPEDHFSLSKAYIDLWVAIFPVE